MGNYLNSLKMLMMSGESGRYNEDFKKKFRTTGMPAMEELARLLAFREHHASFNPGGIAVSGDLTLMGMWREGDGACISMNKDFPGKPFGDILFRHIRHMADFTGGPNGWFGYELLGDSEALKMTILSLRKGHQDLQGGE